MKKNLFLLLAIVASLVVFTGCEDDWFDERVPDPGSSDTTNTADTTSVGDSIVLPPSNPDEFIDSLLTEEQIFSILIRGPWVNLNGESLFRNLETLPDSVFEKAMVKAEAQLWAHESISGELYYRKVDSIFINHGLPTIKNSSVTQIVESYGICMPDILSTFGESMDRYADDISELAELPEFNCLNRNVPIIYYEDISGNAKILSRLETTHRSGNLTPIESVVIKGVASEIYVDDSIICKMVIGSETKNGNTVLYFGGQSYTLHMIMSNCPACEISRRINNANIYLSE